MVGKPEQLVCMAYLGLPHPVHGGIHMISYDIPLK